MTEPPVLLTRDAATGIATATLNRPARGNAYDEAMLDALAAGLAALAPDPTVRALVIRGAGRHFQAGADLDWLARTAAAPPEAAFRASMATTATMQALAAFPRPTIAVVHGACFGGGCGLVASADIALASTAAVFGLTEVRVGVAATPIVVQLAQAIGLRQARRYALTGERFDAAEALRIGLVHEVLAPESLEGRLGAILAELRLAAPGAVAVTKAALLGANGAGIDPREMALLAHESWWQRASAEGIEGLAAVRERRRPAWAGPD